MAEKTTLSLKCVNSTVNEQPFNIIKASSNKNNQFEWDNNHIYNYKQVPIVHINKVIRGTENISNYSAITITALAETAPTLTVTTLTIASIQQ